MWGIAGKVGYVACCLASVVILFASLQANKAVGALRAIGGSHVIKNTPSVGEQNILLMGLESRTYWNGQILPSDVLHALHACSRQGVANGCGGNATNTLILIHIPAGGGKAVGYSIPRDDWVTYPQPYYNETAGKIDDAYGLAMAQKEGELRQSGASLTSDQIAFQGNEAGRAATIATVEKLTGVTIDHFAEVNLYGFYELAKTFGGVEVCLNHPVKYDSYSGFYAHHAGLQHLSPSLALAFVRQRHGLLNGDLDRTHRQQAFIDSILHQIKTEGILTNISNLDHLLSVAKNYVITDSGWNLADFASQMRSLSAKDITFRTLPITGYAKINGQDANTISVPQIQADIKKLFSSADGKTGSAKKPSSSASDAPKPTPASTTVDVYNGGNTAGLAGSVESALTTAGYQGGTVGNTTPRSTTEVLYGSGVAGSADAIAKAFGVTAKASSTVAAGHVKILLGADATSVPPGLPSAGSSAASSASGGATASSTAPANHANGGAVKAGKDGIPCVN